MTTIPSNYKPLSKTVRRPARGARRIGSADPQEKLTVSIRVRRRPDAPPLPDAQQAGAASMRGAAPLSREEFAARYGADPVDLEHVAHFARMNGLQVVESSVARRTVVLSGTVAQMNHAFAVDLGKYESPDGNYRGREDAVHVPADLVDVIEGVFGLDDRKMAKPLNVLGAAQAITPLTPPQVAKLYNFPAPPPTAAGQTIGILEFGGGFLASDVQQYFKQLNLKTPPIAVVGVDGATNAPGNASNPNNADAEVALDISVAGAVAQGANIAMYFAPWTEQGWVDVVTTAVHDATNKPSVLSISWGWPENETIDGLTWTAAAMNAVSSTFQEAMLLGVTVLAASGDNGSGCGIFDGKAHVLYPGCDPWVTSCGGTTIENVSGASFQQATWNDNGVTGGGISTNFPPPYWQAWSGVPASANPGGGTGRGIPDIAGNADPSSGYELVLYGAALGPIGGTSAVAPLYAGLVALLNANLGEPVGYLNYNLYAFAGTDIYTDINDGGSNATDGAPGYKSGPGWDACTGFGSVNGTALLYALEGVGLPPALAEYKGALAMAWKGEERDDRIFFSSFNGTTWAPQALVPNVGTSSGAALAAIGNTLYMAWKGVGADQGIYYSSFNGTSWAAQKSVAGIGSSTGPRLAALGNNLYMIWKGVEGDQRIFWSVFNGSSWTPQQLISGVGTSVGPALAVFNGVLYAVWKGIYGDPSIWYSSFNNGTWATQKQVPNVGTSLGPSLAAFNGKLYAVWKGEFMDQRLWYSSFNGTVWAAQQEIPGVASSVGAGLAASGNALYAAWKGEYGDQSIWYSSFNGTSWAAQKQVPNVGTSPDLVVAKAA